MFYLPFLRIRYSRYPLFIIPFCLVSFGFPSLYRFLVVFLVVFLRNIPNFRLFLRYFRYPLSPICFLFHFRLSFVFYSPSTSLGIGLRLPPSRPVDTGPILHRFLLILILPFVLVPSSFGILLFRFPPYLLPSLPSHRPSSPVSFLLRLLFRFCHLVFCVPVFESAPSARVLWFNPLCFQLSLSSSVSAFVSIFANRLARLNPSSFYPPSFLRSARPLPPSIHHFLSIDYRLRLRLCQCLHGFATVVFSILHQIPVVIRS